MTRLFLLTALICSPVYANPGVLPPPDSFVVRLLSPHNPHKVFLQLKDRLLQQHDPLALRDLYRLAGKNQADAQSLLGYVYDNGIAPANRDARLAGQLWHAAAKQGDPVAMHNLGVLYWHGRGVTRNTDLAQKLFTLAGQHGVARSKAILGQWAEARHDYRTALTLYTDCLPIRYLPNAKTRYSLLLMKTGDMTSTNNREEVYTQLRAAADRWDVEAQYTLARLHAEGVVVRQSFPDTVFWLEVLRRNPAAKPYWSSRDAFIRAYRIGETDRQTGLEMARMWLGTEPRIIPAVDYGKSIIEKDAVF